MIQKNTLLNVIDNSGAKKVCCIHIVSGYRNRYANSGDLVVVSVKSLRGNRKLNSKIKKGAVVKALVVRTKRPLSFFCGGFNSFLENSVILLTSKRKFVGNKIFGPIPFKFRAAKSLKLLSVACGFLN